MDPNIGKTTIGKEKTVTECKESLPTSSGPHRNRFLIPQATWISPFVEGVTDKTPDYPYVVNLSGSRTRSLVSCVQRLRVNTTGLSRDGFTFKGGIDSIRRRPLMRKKRNRKFKCGLLLLKPTQSVESQDTCMFL
jgi:hypothetical protein